MKNIKSLISGSLLVALLASCSAAYKTDQTPDDVYYSPGKPIGEEQQNSSNNQDEYSYNKEDDNYLRMKVQNRSRWSGLDDYSYWNSYNNYSYSGYGYNSFGYNSYNMLGYGYSSLYLDFGYSYYPYYGGYSSYYGGYYPYYGNSYYNPGTYVKYSRPNTGPRANLGGYLNHTYNNSNYSNGLNVGHGGANGSYYQPQQTGVGRLLRTIVTGGNSSSYGNANTPGTTNSYARPMNTGSSAPTSSPSSSSSSSSAGSSRTSGTSTGGGRGH